MHAYSASENRLPAYAALATASVCMAIAFTYVLSRLSVGPTWLVSAPTLGSAYALAFAVMNRWAWRWAPIKALGLSSTPDVSGIYAGELLSGDGFGTRPIQIEIGQTWQQIHIELSIGKPSSSVSRSRTAEVSTVANSGAHLSYTYANRVRPGLADADMGDHDGTADLVLSGDGRLEGRYYTSRGKKGTLTLTRAAN